MKLLYTLPLLLLAGSALAQAPTFAAAVTYSTGGTAPSGVAIGDLNGDGRPDLVVTNYNANSTVGVLLATGAAGTFPATATTYGTGSASSSVGAAYAALADVNADSRLDILLGNQDGTVGVLLNSATTPGTFPATATTYSGSGGSIRGIAVGDLNGDGRPDIAVGNYGTGSLAVLLAAGAPGAFGSARAYPNATMQVDMVRLGDLNGDGQLDLAAINQDGTVGVLLNSAAAPGTFPARTTLYATGGTLMRGLALGDVNGDGRLDIAVTNASSARVLILLNLATAPGTFGTGTPYAVGGSPGNPTLADANGDGKLDLVVPNQNGTVSVLVGQPTTGSFGAPNTFSTQGTTPLNVAVGDLNGDGRPDMATANFGSGTMAVLLSTTQLPTRAALPGVSATLHPNPATTSATLTATGLPAAARTVAATLLDATGRTISRLTLPATGGAATATVPTAGLAAGLYLLRLEAQDAQGAALGALPVQRLAVE